MEICNKIYTRHKLLNLFKLNSDLQNVNFISFLLKMKFIDELVEVLEAKVIFIAFVKFQTLVD